MKPNEIFPVGFFRTFTAFVDTDNDRYSGHGYSGIHRYSGTKPPDDAILFTVSGITGLVE